MAGLAGLVLAGCASTQKVSLECVPTEVRVYVDGRELEGRPQEVKLRVAEPHTVYFKGGSYRPQMVVLESQELDGKRVLSNADMCRTMVFTEMRPEVHMQVDTEEPTPD